MNRTNYLFPLTGLAALTGVSACSQKDNDNERYNVVFIMTDDHTAQMMSCYGSQIAHTPNLDRIARDGVRFTNSFVSNSLSGPSRACILTGKHTCGNLFYDNSTCIFDGSQQTYPKLLQTAGYQTAVVGKWHLGSLPTGFDYWEILPGHGDYYNPHLITMQNDTVQRQGYLTDIITDDAIEWLENGRDRNKPFCLLIHHKAIHRNWLSDIKHLEMFEDRDYPIPETFYDDYEGRPAAKDQLMSVSKDLDVIYDLKMLAEGKDSKLRRTYERILSRMNPEQRAAWDAFYEPIIQDFESRDFTDRELAEWKYQRYIKDYLKVVQSLDENVGRVLDYLEAEGLDKNTLIVYTSDQGFYMGEHGWFDKRFMYEESMHTPLIMKLPKGFDRKGDIDQLVQNIDYAPTFLELAGVKVPRDMHGISLLPLLKGENPKTWRDALYYHYYEFPSEHGVKAHYGVRTDRYKLIHFYKDIDVWELYDLQNDPNELHPVTNDPAYQKVKAKLTKRIAELQTEFDDPVRFSADKARVDGR